jgi:hypothetical protein
LRWGGVAVISYTSSAFRIHRTIPSEAATVDLLDDSEPWNFDAIVDTISSHIEPQEDWILSSPNVPPSDPSRVPMELIDPELQDTLPSFTPSPPATADSVEDAPKTISTPRPGHMESTVAQPLYGNQEVGTKAVAIDAEICEVKALLAKWKQGKTNWYLVKWEAFPDGENMWVKKYGIDPEFVK